ncbi:MAG: right-handed parallel beta-helix repeat-containing protein [Myxococcota bacterium]
MVTATTMLLLGVFSVDLDVGAGQTYTTIGDAIDAAQAGDVIRVHPGTYAEDLDLGGGTEGNPIRIEAVEPLMATLQGVIDIGGTDWEIAGLTIETPDGPDGIQISGDRILLEGLDMSGGTRDGIDGGGVDVTVRQSTIHLYDAGDSDAHCIVLNPGAENWVIEDNELFDCSGDGVQLFSSGAERTIINTTIQRNIIYYTGAISRTENAIDVKNADGLYIRENLMYGFGDNKTLVFQKGPANIEVTCNEMNDGFTGVEFRGEDGGVVENVLFAHNLMVGFEQYALKFDEVVGADVHNNTFVDIDGDGLRFEEESLQGGSVRNNLWVNATQVENDGDFEFEANGFWNVDDNQIGSASDVTDDPMLDADYRLMGGSPLVDAGVDVGLEFAGEAPDIGWDEVDGNPCAAPPDPGDDGGDDSDSGADETGGDDAGDGMDDGGDGGSGGPSGGGDDGGGDGGGDDGGTGGPGDGTSDDGGAADDDADGCSCRSSSRHGGWALGLLLLGFVRRRRLTL